MNNMLDCMWIKGDRHREGREGRLKRKIFTLCTLEKLRGREYIVQANALADELHGTVLQNSAVQQ